MNPNSQPRTPNPNKINTSLEREITVEDGVNVKAREVLSRSGRLLDRVYGGVARLSDAVNSAATGISNVADVPATVMAGVGLGWHEWNLKQLNKVQERRGAGALLSRSGFLRNYQQSLRDYHSNNIVRFGGEIKRLEGSRAARLAGLSGERSRVQNTLDNFAKKRVEAEIRRWERIEAKQKEREIGLSGTASPEELKVAVEAHLSDPEVKKRIAEKAVRTVKLYLDW